jgi:hypothetical protein
MQRTRGSLVPVEFDPVQDALEFLAWVEAGQNAADLVGAHVFGGIGAFTGCSQPEATEIAQFYDVALRQFGGDNGEGALDRCHHIDGVSVDICAPVLPAHASSRTLKNIAHELVETGNVLLINDFPAE